MKKSTCLAILVLLLAGSAWGASVTLKWDENQPPVAGYRLFTRLAGQDYDYNQPAWEGAGTTATIDGLATQATYYFVVRAFEGDAESGNSNEASYLAVATPAVENVVGVNNGVAIFVSWTLGQADQYRLYYGLFPGQYFTPEELDSETDLFELPAYLAAYPVYVRVRAVLAGQEGPGEEIRIEPLSIPGEVQVLAAFDSGLELELSWAPVQGHIDQYEVYWSFFPGSYPLAPLVLPNTSTYTTLTRYGIKTYVKILARNARGASPSWQEREILPYTVPYKITGTEIGKTAGGQLYASWDLSLGLVSAYRVYWSFWSHSFSMAPITVSDGNNIALPSYLNSYASPIFVYVVGVNALGESPEKQVVSAIPRSIAPDP